MFAINKFCPGLNVIRSIELFLEFHVTVECTLGFGITLIRTQSLRFIFDQFLGMRELQSVSSMIKSAPSAAEWQK